MVFWMIFNKIKDNTLIINRLLLQLSPFWAIKSIPNEIIEKIIPLYGDSPELKIIKE